MEEAERKLGVSADFPPFCFSLPKVGRSWRWTLGQELLEQGEGSKDGQQQLGSAQQETSCYLLAGNGIPSYLYEDMTCP
jgi:hypothetical protein